MIITESQYKDDLELLIKFFRNPLRTFEVRLFERRRKKQRTSNVFN